MAEAGSSQLPWLSPQPLASLWARGPSPALFGDICSLTPSRQLLMATLLRANLSQLVPVPRLSRASSGVSSIPSSPHNRVLPNQDGPRPNRTASGQQQPRAGQQRWGHTGDSHQQMAMASRPARTEPALSSAGSVSPGRHVALQILTRSLVFDEEKLQPLLEGVFIHVELDLHPVGKAPRGAHQRGGRSDLEPPRSPVPAG